MDASRYSTIRVFDPGNNEEGYKVCHHNKAQEFFQQTLLGLDPKQKLSAQWERDIQDLLLSWFRAEPSTVETTSQALAGLCLRCYVSSSILKACKTLASQFCLDYRLTYRELLSYVLNDDGKTPIILDSDGKTQLVLNQQGQIKRGLGQFFTIDVLASYRLNSSDRLSLDNWAYRKTKQHPDIKRCLAEQGLPLSSNWSLLGRVKLRHLEQLYPRDRKLVETFHTVYSQDRQQQRRNRVNHRVNHRVNQCLEPRDDQLQDMLHLLPERGVIINSTKELHKELTRIAKGLQEEEIWSRRGSPIWEPLEARVPETGEYVPKELPDLNSINTIDHLGQSELQDFLEQGLIEVLDHAIGQALVEHIASLEQSRRYACFASKVIPGFRFFYCEGKSLKEIATLLNMTNHSQASRVLAPGKLLNHVQYLSVENFFQLISTTTKGLGLEENATKLDYLSNVMQEVEAFLNTQVFQAAVAELSTSKSRSMNSLYAQRLCRYLDEYNKKKQGANNE
ncbi:MULTISPECIES: hypothetical protein [unclassified Moorena]|uniref:hypothetical protein n=1 Tax=unclassified Moorena TaxID=2683338 RepID=UPI0013FFA1C6|nr:MULTISPECIES: hypothetical protein [unclassified Moorena]NEO14752.1 hypothetical protein [Moorena sp. SIO3E8]NEQ00559.1 hypothetical protein [Moorena sp. SIO3F7]